MNEQAIIRGVHSALDAIGASAKSELDLAVLLHHAEHEPQKVDNRLSGLLGILREDPELKIFDGAMQVLPNQASRVDYCWLGRWLLRRGSEVGVEQAVADLKRYIETSAIPYLLTFALSGIEVGEPCNLGRGVSLLPWEQVPESVQKQSIHEKFLMTADFRWPTAAMVREETLAKIHIHGAEVEKYMIPLDDTDLRDATLCISLCGPTAPFILASWLAPPPWAPVMTGGYSMPFPEGKPRHGKWPQLYSSEASQLFQTFAALPDARKDLLRLVMQRLNSAMRRLSNVDSAIDLGIALESLFLDDMDEARGEMTFRLRFRASRFMGKSRTERLHLYKLVGDLYSARSSAIHSGRVSSTMQGRPTDKILEEGYRLTADTVKRCIINGQPDWTTVLFE